MSESFDAARSFLRDLDRLDLVALLAYSTYRLVMVDVWHDIEVPGVEITSPGVFTEALEGLSEPDKRRIREAIEATDPALQARRTRLERVLFAKSAEPSPDSTEAIVAELLCLRQSLMGVATGEQKLEDVTDYYKARRRRIARALQAHGLSDPILYADLRDWYRDWQQVGTLQERRAHINGLLDPLLEQLVQSQAAQIFAREPTGWERVDRALSKARSQLDRSKHEEDFQQVGLLCREVMISLGQAAYDPAIHSPTDSVVPSDSDARRMIEAVIAAELPGSTNENLRRNVKTTLQVALELQHHRNAHFRIAAACLESTSSVVNLVAILVGVRSQGPAT